MSDGALYAEAERAIDEAYKAYIDGFMRGPAAAAACWGVPALFVLPERVIAMQTHADLEGFYAATLSRLKSSGYSHSDFIRRSLKLLNEKTALYGTSFVRMKTDGTELERLATTYLFRNDGSGWKIFSLIGTDQDKLL